MEQSQKLDQKFNFKDKIKELKGTNDSKRTLFFDEVKSLNSALGNSLILPGNLYLYSEPIPAMQLHNIRGYRGIKVLYAISTNDGYSTFLNITSLDVEDRIKVLNLAYNLDPDYYNKTSELIEEGTKIKKVSKRLLDLFVVRDNVSKFQTIVKKYIKTDIGYVKIKHENLFNGWGVIRIIPLSLWSYSIFV